MKHIKTRISAMMFLYYFALGIVIPLFSLYLRNYTNLTEAQIGWVQGMQMISSIVAPILGALIIDKFIAAEKMFSLLQLFSGIFIIAIYFVSSFPAILVLNLLYWFTMGPCTPLTNSIAFHYISNEKDTFGNIRLWGTLGWMISGILFGIVWQRVLGGSVKASLIFSGMISFFLFAYSLTLPGVKNFKAPENKTKISEVLKFFLNPTILIICILSILVRTVDKYFYTGIPIFMDDIGFQTSNILPLMTVGQITEITAMFFLAFLLKKFKYRTLLRWGIVSEIIRFGMLGLAQYFQETGSQELFYKGLAMVGLTFHGFAFALFFTTAYIYLDHHLDPKNRTGVHQLFTLITGVLSGFIGNYLGGKLLETFKSESGTNYIGYWLVPIAISAVALALSLGLKRIKDKAKVESIDKLKAESIEEEY
ncbi:MAG: MFS transporter [Spirochaetales bacterium]|nr:MFS transporter [Spirochaetales bacterium]